jgi:hypothetical protein
MTLKEFMEWVAYYNVEPWGSRVDGMRMAVSTAATYNAGLMMNDPKRLRNNPFKAEDFYVGVDCEEKPVKKQNWQEMRDKMSLLVPKDKNK